MVFNFSSGVSENYQREEFAENFTFAGAREEGDENEPNGLNKFGSSSTAELHPKAGGGRNMPPASVMTRLILIMVWRKLIRNPNTYSSLIGLIWSLVSFRYTYSDLLNIQVNKSISFPNSVIF